MNRRSKVYTWSDEDFIELVRTSSNYSEMLISLGLTPYGGGSTKILKERINNLHCSTEHFKLQAYNASASIRRPIDSILVKNSEYKSIATLKRRLVREGKLPYRCDVCGISEWNGLPISLQLDHINGINNDHRLDNLRFICPNCHSQTTTYAGKNRKYK